MMKSLSVQKLFKRVKSVVFTQLTSETKERLMKNGNGNGDLAAKVQKILAEAAQKISVLCNSQVGSTDDDLYDDSVQAEPATVAMSYGGLTGTPLFRLTDADRRKRPLDFVWRTHGKTNPRS